MKQGIHPTYYAKATITCACGAVLETGSTVETMHTEICALCHPLYTGKKKVIDTTGRVDRFKKMTEKSQAKQISRKKAPKVAESKEDKKSAKKTEKVAA
ncbi:MAG: 50S ribosomal protein L31 [Candidatus Moraniibacteriota bacterium]